MVDAFYAQTPGVWNVVREAVNAIGDSVSAVTGGVLGDFRASAVASLSSSEEEGLTVFGEDTPQDSHAPISPELASLAQSAVTCSTVGADQGLDLVRGTPVAPLVVPTLVAPEGLSIIPA